MNRNFRHSWTSWLRVANASSSSGRVAGSADDPRGVRAASRPYARARPVEVPGPAHQRRASRRRERGREPLGAHALGLQQRVDLLRRVRGADPGRVVELRVAEEGQARPDRSRAAALASGSVGDEEVPGAVPARQRRCGRCARPRRRDGVRRAVGERVARAFGQPDRVQPALPDHPRDRGADGRRRRRRAGPAAGPGRRRVPGRRGRAGGRRTGRTALSGRSHGAVCRDAARDASGAGPAG